MATQHSSPVDAVPAAARPQVRELLNDILLSTPFRTSRQCQDMFRYIVEQSLAGSDESLRERAIGIEVFGRAPDYDTAEDPVVRLRAADVRKRLAQYYQAQKNSTELWKIEVPTGSYKAQFQCPGAAVAQVATATDVSQPSNEVVGSQNAAGGDAVENLVDEAIVDIGVEVGAAVLDDRSFPPVDRFSRLGNSSKPRNHRE